MPNRRIHEQFDKYLRSKGILLPDGKYGIVHSFMDKGTQTWGSEHREEDFFHWEEGLRSWINGKYNVIGQDRATDWLRAGLGHICLDYAKSRNPDKSVESWFKSAYRSMCQKSWDRSRFYHRR